MIRTTLVLAVLAGSGAIAAYATTKTAPAPTPRVVARIASGADVAHPAVIELFQSQGCSSCPPALAVLDQIASRPDVLALNFAVTYWDQLGWKDSFAQPAFTARQWDYARAQGRGNVATPQLIVNGRTAVLGSYKPEVERAIVGNARAPGPEIAVHGSTVEVAAGRSAQPATVWLVSYDPRRIDVPIRAGENGGRTLPHRNVVRQLRALGSWTGKAASFSVPALSSGYARAVLVQSGTGGAIVAAARI